MPLFFLVLSSFPLSPTSDGAGAAVLASEPFVRKYHLQNQAVEIVAQEMVTDLTSTFEENSCIKMARNLKLKVIDTHTGDNKQIIGLMVTNTFPFQVGYDMSQLAAKKCFEAAGLKPNDVDVVELHDCFSANELITYEALGLCPEGKTASHQTLMYSPYPLSLYHNLCQCFP